METEVADGHERGIDGAHVTAERVVGGIVGGVILTGVVIVSLVLRLALDGVTASIVGGGLAAAALVIVGLLQWWPGFAHPYTRWRLDDTALRIRRGVHWRAEIDVPRARVQHVDVIQGPLARQFGLGKVIVHTAGTIDATVELDGLAIGTARAIRNHLLLPRADDAV